MSGDVALFSQTRMYGYPYAKITRHFQIFFQLFREWNQREKNILHLEQQPMRDIELPSAFGWIIHVRGKQAILSAEIRLCRLFNKKALPRCVYCSLGGLSSASFYLSFPFKHVRGEGVCYVVYILKRLLHKCTYIM